MVAILVALGSVGLVAQPIQAQGSGGEGTSTGTTPTPTTTPVAETSENGCNYVWCATASAWQGAAVGTLSPLQYGNVSYTVDSITNDAGTGTVSLGLTPLPEEGAFQPLTLHLGDEVLPFALADRVTGAGSDGAGSYVWTDATLFGTGNTHFGNGATLELAIVEDALPGAPVIDFHRATGGDQIIVQWAAPEHQGATPITAYFVESALSDGEWSESEHRSPLAVGHVKTHLLASTEYRYRVSAINSIGRGPASQPVTITTGPLQAPHEPRPLTAIPWGTTIQLSWSVPIRSGGAPITGYKIQYHTGDAVWLDAGTVDERSIDHTGLTIGTTYYYRVAAINAEVDSVGASRWSTVEQIAEANVPDEPHNVTVQSNGDGTNMAVSWTAPGDGGSSITGYRVHKSTDEQVWGWDGQSVYASSTGTSFDHAVASDDGPYFYRVAAVNAIGQSEWSQSAILPGNEVAPGPPLSFFTIPDVYSIRLGWEAPGTNGGAPITGYRIESSTDGNSWNLIANSADGWGFKHEGLQPGTTYSYRIYAVNSAGLASSPFAEVSQRAIPAYAGPPENMQATVDEVDVTLSWEPPTDDGGSPVTSYVIWLAENDGPWVTIQAYNRDTDFTLYGYLPGDVLKFRVLAVNERGPGHTASFTFTVPAVMPQSPRDFQAQSTPRSTTIALSWREPGFDGGADIQGYRIQRSTDGQTWTDLDRPGVTVDLTVIRR